MNFWLQSLSADEFMEINQAVTLKGVYVCAQDLLEKEVSVRKVLTDLLEVMSEDQILLVDVPALGFRSMLEEARRLKKLSSRIVMTVPAITQGLMALKACRTLNLTCACNSIFQSSQALLAAHNQPAWLLMDESAAARNEGNPEYLKLCLQVLDEEHRKKAIAISLESPAALTQAAALGYEHACARPSIYRSIADNPLAVAKEENFRENWILQYTRTELLDDEPFLEEETA